MHTKPTNIDAEKTCDERTHATIFEQSQNHSCVFSACDDYYEEDDGRVYQFHQCESGWRRALLWLCASFGRINKRAMFFKCLCCGKIARTSTSSPCRSRKIQTHPGHVPKSFRWTPHNTQHAEMGRARSVYMKCIWWKYSILLRICFMIWAAYTNTTHARTIYDYYLLKL